MEDRTLMESMLLSEKNACDLYLHGVIEASTPEVRDAMKNGLESSLRAQDQIYSAMAQQGWYPAQQAPGQQIDQTRQKFEQMQ